MIEKSSFPKDFSFGVATSAYQIEGHQFGGAGPTIWDQFAAQGGTKNSENGAMACDHYHRYHEDIRLIAEGNFDSYRFSMSWARIMPDGKTLNPQGIDFYNRLIDQLLESGIAPFVTAYHWELPLVLGEQGGWLSRDTALYFADYMKVLVEKFGNRVTKFITINEPWCVSWLSHFHGAHAPGIKDLSSAVKAMHYVLLAHGLGMEAARSVWGQIELGIALNFEPGYSASASKKDVEATERHNAIYNHWFLSAVTRGSYPKICLKEFGDALPVDWQDDMEVIQSPLDFIGVNYYTRKIIKHKPGSYPFIEEIDGGLEKTDMGWEISPNSLGELLEFVQTYSDNIPLYITENGMASKSGIDDQDRIEYFQSHLKVVAERVRHQPILGYMLWSFLDNFEWALGYDKRFGVVHVDYESQRRTPKSSYYFWQKFLQNELS